MALNNKSLLDLPSKLVPGHILRLKMSIAVLWLNDSELRDKSLNDSELRDKSLKSPHDTLCFKFVLNANFINVMHCSY